MFKKLLLFSILTTLLGFPMKAVQTTLWSGEHSLSWSDKKFYYDSDYTYNNFETGGKLIFNLDGDCWFKLATEGNGTWEQIVEANSSNSQFVYTIESKWLDALKKSIIVQGDYKTLRSIVYEDPEGGNTDPQPGETKKGELMTDLGLDFDKTNGNGWNDEYNVKLNHQFVAGDKIIFDGYSKNGDPQLQFRFLKDGKKETIANADNGTHFEYTLTDEQARCINADGIFVKGQHLVITKISYEGQAEPVAGGELVGDDNGGGNTDPQPGETYEGVLFEKPESEYGLDLWMDWNKDENKYKVYFKHKFEAGDVIILTISEKYDGNQYQIGVNYPEWKVIRSGSWPDDSFEIVLTADEAEAINQKGLYLQGQNYKVSKISYRGKNAPVPGGQIYAEDGTLKYGEEEDNDAEEDTEEYDQSRVVDLMSRIQEMSYINHNWGDVTIENVDGGVKATTSKGEGFGVMSKALAELSQGEGKLSNDIYNGTKHELDQYGKNTEKGGSTDDEFLDFHRFDRVIITLDKQVKGARVVLYYRDLDWDNYNDEEVEEYPEYEEFAGNTTTFKVDLTPYRYLRAIALRVPEAGEYTVTRFFLYEREKYAEQKANTDAGTSLNDGLSLPMEIWHPSDDNGKTAYEGVNLGTKRMYDENDDWRCDPEAGETLAWSNDITIDGKILEEAIPFNTKTLYHCFAIVYKNAYTVKGSHSDSPEAETHGQIQMYVNFPAYRTNDMTPEEKEYWAEQSWTDGDGYSNEKIISPINTDNKDLPYEEAIYTPNVRNSHTFRTVGTTADEYDGSVYLPIPDSKHDQYTYGRIYLKVNQDIDYPVKQETGDIKPLVSMASSTVDTKTDNILKLIHENGIAIRGQNVSVMKVVYLGNLMQETAEENYKPDDYDEEEAADFGTTGIEEVIIDMTPAAPAVVNVYNLQGIMVRKGVATENALDGLANGIYIVNGKKVWIK